jgi:uncharacterized membrane protein YhiD involved in acid resistance
MSDTPTPMQPSTPPSRKGTVVFTVLLTLVSVFIFEKLVAWIPPNSYRDQLRRSEVLLHNREWRDKQAQELLNRMIEDQKQGHNLLIDQENDNDRYKKILDRWEQQQKAYQAYLDSLKKPQ